MSSDRSERDLDELADAVVERLEPGSYGDKMLLNRRQLLALAGAGVSAGALGTLGVTEAEAQEVVGQIGTDQERVDVLGGEGDFLSLFGESTQMKKLAASPEWVDDPEYTLGKFERPMFDEDIGSSGDSTTLYCHPDAPDNGDGTLDDPVSFRGVWQYIPFYMAKQYEIDLFSAPDDDGGISPPYVYEDPDHYAYRGVCGSHLIATARLDITGNPNDPNTPTSGEPDVRINSSINFLSGPGKLDHFTFEHIQVDKSVQFHGTAGWRLSSCVFNGDPSNNLNALSTKSSRLSVRNCELNADGDRALKITNHADIFLYNSTLNSETHEAIDLGDGTMIYAQSCALGGASDFRPSNAKPEIAGRGMYIASASYVILSRGDRKHTLGGGDPQDLSTVEGQFGGQWKLDNGSNTSSGYFEFAVWDPSLDSGNGAWHTMGGDVITT